MTDNRLSTLEPHHEAAMRTDARNAYRAAGGLCVVLLDARQAALVRLSQIVVANEQVPPLAVTEKRERNVDVHVFIGAVDCADVPHLAVPSCVT